MISKFGYVTKLIAITVLTSCSVAGKQDSLDRQVASLVPGTNVEWPHYGGDLGASKFSNLGTINKENVSHLKVAWQWNSIDNPIIKHQGIDTAYYEATPIMTNSMLYTSTSLNQVVALNPETGELIWQFDPETYKNGYPPNSGFVHRGVSFWTDGKQKRIFIGTNDAYLIALNADTGKVYKNFGSEGRIDLTEGLRRKIARDQYGVTSPPLICRNTIIVGSSIADFFFKLGMPPGDVRGFDASTGKLKWTFHTIPQESESGVETWDGDSSKIAGNTNVWAPMSADQELGAVYLPISTPSNDYYGGERGGDNLYAESLVSLDCETGKRNWHFQLVHHGLWDYDSPAAPILADIIVNGKPVKAVIQVTKQAFAYVFDRITGKPVWPIIETPVPQSKLAGEVTSPTQPIPTLPLAFDLQGISDDNLIDFTPALRKSAKKVISEYEYGPLFTPPAAGKGTINLPGDVGGASWAGAAFSPVTGKLYVPSVTNPHVISLDHVPFTDYEYTSVHPKYLLGAEGLPLTKPPYGRITAIDMNTGAQSWMVPIGEGPKSLLAAQGVKVSEDLGWPRRTHVLVTPTLLFAVQSGYYEISGVHFRNLLPNSVKIQANNDDPLLRVLDPETGATIAKVKLPANSYAAPMTYSFNGKQYVVMSVGGGGTNLDAGIIAVSNGE